MNDKDLLRNDRAALEQVLKEAGARIRGRSVLCPFHDDKHPSGSIYEYGGVWRFKCMACDAGGDVFDIRALANGTTSADELRKESGTRPKRKKKEQKTKTFASIGGIREFLKKRYGPVEFEHTYTTEDGEYFQTVFRCRTADGKTCRPCHLTDAGYVLKATEKPWRLYNLPAVTRAETVVVVEGEKCADVLNKYGFVATTSQGGAKNARHTDWTLLAGKSIILWPDPDADGRCYTAVVEGILQGLQPAPRISILDPAQLDLAEHEDAADFISQLMVIGKSDAEITAAIDAVLKKAKIVSIASDVRQRFADIRAGRYAAIQWLWELVGNLTKALLPGTVTILAGSAGATKSFMALQVFIFWMSLGLRVALFEIEENRVFHLTRALAQKSGCAWLTDPDEVKERADEADGIAAEHEAFLDKFGRVLHATPESQPSLEQLAAWIQEQAKKSFRIIGVDPISVAARTGDIWKADAKFLQNVKRTATDYGCSVLLVTHPVKNVTFPDLTQLAGSACYQRFAQTILWLEHHEEKASRVRTSVGTTEMEHNKTLYILKARNGRGGGYKLAIDFNTESLTLHELGLIMGKKKNG